MRYLHMEHHVFGLKCTGIVCLGSVLCISQHYHASRNSFSVGFTVLKNVMRCLHMEHHVFGLKCAGIVCLGSVLCILQHYHASRTSSRSYFSLELTVLKHVMC